MDRSMSMDTIKAMNDRAGYHWFEPSTLRFFRSRVSQCAAELPNHDGWLFVSSEQFDYKAPRLYSVRWAKQDGSIDTVGDFQQYGTSAQAWRAIARIVKDWPADKP